MTKVLGATLAVMMALAMCTMPARGQQPSPPFEIESGRLSMTLEMLGVQLAVSLHFDHFGMRQITRLTGDANGRAVDVANLEARGYQLLWDNGTRRGQRTPLTGNPRGPLALVAGLDPSAAPVEGTSDTLTVLGRLCTGSTIRDSGVVAHIWRWKGLPLRVQVVGDNAEINLVATDVDTTTPIGETPFDVPDDVAITEF